MFNVLVFLNTCCLEVSPTPVRAVMCAISDFLTLRTDTGAEDDMTDSGYPRQVREWKRGLPLKDAPLVYEAEKKDISSFASRYYDRGFFHEMRGRAITFWTSEYFWLHQGEWKKARGPPQPSTRPRCRTVLVAVLRT